MEVETQESFGLLENDVIIAMTRQELNDLRLLLSLARYYLHPALSEVGDEFLQATDDL